MVLNHVQSGCLLTEILDHNDGAAAHLAGLAFLVDLAQAGPLAELLVGVHADQRDLVLVAQGSDQLLVVGLIEGLGQDAQHGLTSAEQRITLVSVTPLQDFFLQTCAQ